MMPHMGQWIIAGLLGSAASVFLLSKCFFLAPHPAGWLMLAANLAYEVAERKTRFDRWKLDALAWAGLSLGFGLWAGAGAGLAAALGLGLAWVGALRIDSEWKAGRTARQCRDCAGRVPLPIPRLIVAVRGPVLERNRGVYDLGDWLERDEQSFEVQVLNPACVPAQMPVEIHVTSATAQIEVRGSAGCERPGPAPGEIVSMAFSLRATMCGPGGDVRLHVQHGDFQFQRTLRVGSILPRSQADIRQAVIRRWKHGARGAFVWRGDQDLYDPATFQSVEGLRHTLGLARRFRMPNSLMLSSRLSLLPKDHRAFCERFGWDRKTDGIPEFVRFLRDEVDTSAEQEWPVDVRRPYAAEIANHMHLHYGTHAAADPGNGWKSHAGIGAGHYPWLSRNPVDSFTEQRDNARECSRVFREELGIEPASFTIPSDVFDGDTARAMEAAGLEVGSETDCPKWKKLVWLSAPHHPEGCGRFVELPRMHPRDPENAFQLAMAKFWVGVARRSGRALVFLAHHHLMRYQGGECAALVEEMLHHVLADNDGDLFVGTLAAVGRYWRDVLSPRTRCVKVRVDGARVTVENAGPRALHGLPLEIDLGGGRRQLRLVNVPAMETMVVEV
jgi:hypothetical protein